MKKPFYIISGIIIVLGSYLLFKDQILPRLRGEHVTLLSDLEQRQQIDSITTMYTASLFSNQYDTTIWKTVATPNVIDEWRAYSSLIQSELTDKQIPVVINPTSYAVDYETRYVEMSFEQVWANTEDPQTLEIQIALKLKAARSYQIADMVVLEVKDQNKISELDDDALIRRFSPNFKD